MAGFEVREAAVEDAELVWSVMQQAFAEYEQHEASTGALRETVEYVAELLESGKEHGVLCLVDGKPVGSARFRIEDSGLYFRRLGVAPEYRGRGVATAMVSWMEGYAAVQGIARVWCSVRKILPGNVRLYESLGYVVCGERIKPTPEGVEVVLLSMEKTL